EYPRSRTVEDIVHSLDRGASREHRRLVGQRGDIGIAVEVGSSSMGDVLDEPDVLRVMHQRNVLGGSRLRIEHGPLVDQPALVQVTLNRHQALGIFRMCPGVVEAKSIRKDQRGRDVHAPQYMPPGNATAMAPWPPSG